MLKGGQTDIYVSIIHIPYIMRPDSTCSTSECDVYYCLILPVSGVFADVTGISTNLDHMIRGKLGRQ